MLRVSRILSPWFCMASLKLGLTIAMSLTLAGTVVAETGSDRTPESTPENSACPPPVLSRLKRHAVKSGETLASIAQQYNLLPATLQGLNPTLQSGQVSVGQTLLVPPFNGVRVQVPAGQTWRQIADAYGVRADVLFELNGCQTQPTVVFVPGATWVPQRPNAAVAGSIQTYPLPQEARMGLNHGWQILPNRTTVSFHSGIDLLASPNTPVLAAGDGVVAFAGEEGAYGLLVVINHTQGRQTRYAHLAQATVKTGQRVGAGQQIGTVGASGSPDILASHLHFEVRYNSALGWVAENPEQYFRALKQTSQ